MARTSTTKVKRRAPAAPAAPPTTPAAASPVHLPLTNAMHGLLSTLLTAIDRRVDIINSLGDGKKSADHEPETCDACGGTGLILVSSTIVVNDDSDSDLDDLDDASVVLVDDDSVLFEAPADNSQATDDGALGCTAEMQAYMEISKAFTAARAAASACTGGPSAPVSNLSGPGVAPVFTPAGTPAPVPVVAPGPAVAPSPASVSSSVTTTPAGTPAPAPMSSNGPVPSASQVIAGFHRLGPAHPVPPPANAVFCVPGGERYYAVTKGIRVGVFGGWLNTTPYVTGVPSSASSRHSTIEAAYDVYCDAYNNGLVGYV